MPPQTSQNPYFSHLAQYVSPSSNGATVPITKAQFQLLSSYWSNYYALTCTKTCSIILTKRWSNPCAGLDRPWGFR